MLRQLFNSRLKFNNKASIITTCTFNQTGYDITTDNIVQNTYDIYKGGMDMKDKFNVHLQIDASTTITDVTINTYEQEIGNNLLKYIQQYETPNGKIGIKTSQGVYLITKTDIIFAEVFDKQLTIATTEETYTTRMSLNALQQSLPENKFVQITKSSIVNIEHITKVSPSFSGNLYATLINNQKVTISRRYVKNLTQILGI